MKATSIDGSFAGLPTRYIEAFLERLRTARYRKLERVCLVQRLDAQLLDQRPQNGLRQLPAGVP